MKKLLLMMLLLLFSISGIIAQEVSVLKPEKPKSDATLSISYDAKKSNSDLKDAKDLSIYLAFFKLSTGVVVKEFPMTKSGDYFTIDVKIPSDSTVYLMYKFIANDKKDDNDGKWWDSYIFDRSGKIVVGAYYQKSISYRYPSDMTRKRDQNVIDSELQKEISSGSNLFPAMIANWSSKLSKARADERSKDEEKSKSGKKAMEDLKADLTKSFNEKTIDENIALSYYSLANSLKMDDLVSRLKGLTGKFGPKGNFAQYLKYLGIAQEKDEKKKNEQMEQFVEENPGSRYNDNFYYSLYNTYLKQNNVEKKRKLLENAKFSNNYYLSLISKMEIDSNKDIKGALALNETAIDMLKSGKSGEKPFYMSEKDWNKSQKSQIGDFLSVKGKGLLKIKETSKAIEALSEAFNLQEKESDETNTLFVEALVQNKENENAMKIAEECVISGKFTPEMLKHFETAYIAVKGSNKGFKEMMDKYEGKQKEDLKKKILSEKINKPAPDFTLKDLSGKTFKLSDLKGKIILVDFWATWCGPCKSSFPFLQQAFEKYKTNEKVQFFAVDTWEQVKGKEREDLVNKFMKDNKYTYPVLYDDEDNSVIGKYEVTGIPTKFMIDQNGMIQFKSIGFDKGLEMLREIDIWVDILLSDSGSK